MIIRYLYRCKDSDCHQLTYRKANEAIGAVHCRRCGELAREDESGRILINSRHLIVQTETGFGFSGHDVLVKGKMAELPFYLGERVEVSGTINYKRKVLNASRITPNQPPASNLTIPAEFQFLLRELEAAVSPVIVTLNRVILSAICAAILRTSLLVLVRTADTCAIVQNLLETVFADDAKTFFPSLNLLSGKAELPCLLSCQNGVFVIPRFDLFTGNRRERMRRAIAQDSVGGHHLNCGKICIAVSPVLEGREFEPFNLIVRVETPPKAVFEDVAFGRRNEADSERVSKRVAGARLMLDRISLSDTADDVLTAYSAACQRNREGMATDFLLQIATGIAAFRHAVEIEEVDALIAVYLFEETAAALTGDDSAISQLPVATGFFSPSMSAMPTQDETVLFHSWVSAVKRFVE
jgi:hypothetical protein